MASRNFPDFLTAYFDYARDNFSPDSFHKWVGVACVAGALERRVWVEQSRRKTFPNLYVFLVSIPGEGKSSAGDLGMLRLLRKVRRENTKVSFLPDQMTEAAFIDSMQNVTFFLKNVVDEQGNWRVDQEPQCAHFLYASEASNSLKELAGGGEITAALTEFYDCRDVWSKKTKGGGETPLNNICCNLLAGSTFSHMNVLFPPSRILGGFASRIIYVANRDTKGRKIKWEQDERSPETEAKLLTDLTRIFELSGQFSVTEEFAREYVAFFEQYDGGRRGLKDERMQAFLSRRHTNMLKLAMICSVSESDSLLLERRHWDRALTFLPEMDKSLDLVMDSAANVADQSGINYKIMRVLKQSGGNISNANLLRKCHDAGITPAALRDTILLMRESGQLGFSNGTYVLAADPDNNL